MSSSPFHDPASAAVVGVSSLFTQITGRQNERHVCSTSGPVVSVLFTAVKAQARRGIWDYFADVGSRPVDET